MDAEYLREGLKQLKREDGIVDIAIAVVYLDGSSASMQNDDLTYPEQLADQLTDILTGIDQSEQTFN